MTRRLSLNGVWRYAPQAHVLLKPGGVWEESADDLPPAGEMNIPVNWQLGGLDNFHGRVRFERTFEFDGLEEGEESVWLHFQAVDYYAQVWLNDHLLGRHQGYFQPFEFDVTDAICTGVNRLRVDVSCPKEEPGTLWPDQKVMLKGVLSHWDCRPGSWDPETAQDKNSGGIWHDVYLETRPEAYIDYAGVTTRLLPDDVPSVWALGVKVDPERHPLQAMVSVDCDIVGPPGAYTLAASIGHGRVFEESITLKQSGEQHTVIVRVPDPALWWTWDLGDPHLETCTIQLRREGRCIHERRIQVGLREISMDEATGQWFLNGKRFFVRGVNVVPTLWLGEYDQAMIDKDIQMLRDAHVNGVRVCVHVNRDEFYTACDRAGLIVWQDFAFQWGYTATHEFMLDAVRQIREMVRLLVNHPSIALWCTENESGLYNDYVLAPMLAQAIAAEDTSRTIHPVAKMEEHTYGGWYYGHYRDYATLPGAPIVSEFGAQALPDLQTVKELFGDTWPPDWDEMGYHDFQYNETFVVAGIETGDGWEAFVENSQAYQARLLKYAIEHYRKAKYEDLGGIFQFMFMDCWPSITWSVVGYDRTPKQGYHALRQSYQPILIGLPPNEWSERKALIGPPNLGSQRRPPRIQPWVVNDLHRAFEGCTYRVTLEGPGDPLTFMSDERFDIPPDSVVPQVPGMVLSIPDDTVPGEYTLVITLSQGEEVLSVNSYPLTLVVVE